MDKDYAKEGRQKFIKGVHDKVAKKKALERMKNVDIKRKYPNTQEGRKPYINPNYNKK